ncbi:MAG: lipopolysaccharide biosynthesis protein [Thiomonas sp.]|uniref:lipopolysaccharide biosynthesis protein n=1 Tax=Thiomonas sp. TaxID=2047785 RepID=UPI002A36AC82|nr:lipopolysaccharide biosynthesis protein [Thiomonas sp.]MDY0330914.1 lipopolysaccharide biosynthesis protein [Thiomonas sp.]
MRWRPGAYARDGACIFMWLLLRAAAQAATVLLLARWLGAEGYGVFVAALAVASFFTPLAGMGMAAILLRDGAREPERIDALLRQALRWWRRSAVLSIGVGVLAMQWGLPSALPWAPLVALAAGEIAAGSLVEILSRMAQARHRAARFGAIQAGLPGVRLLALLALAMFAVPTPTLWMLVYGASSLGYAAALLWVETRSIQPMPSAHIAARDGLPFVTGALSYRLQAEFNKPVLAHLGYAQAGAFGIAQRVVDLAALPLSALQEALWPRLFASADPRKRALRSGAALLLLALLAGGVLMLAAPLLPWLLGADYEAAANTLVWLAFLPALQVARNLGNAWLMACGQTAILNPVYIAASVVGMLLTVVLAPRFGLNGAAAAAYGAEATALLAQWLLPKWEKEGGR